MRLRRAEIEPAHSFGQGDTSVGFAWFDEVAFTRHAIMATMTDRPSVRRWVENYERAWRTPGTAEISTLFTIDATYLHSPYEEPVVGVDAIARMWEEDREGSNELFTLSTELVAVDEPMAVVRAEVRYGRPVHQEYRDLWILRLEADGRCSWFEEWPYWPGRSFVPREA
jgi:ketosteroid isomerase-like protein